MHCERRLRKDFYRQEGTTASRPGWDELLSYIRAGDILVITELSRMTRSLMHLLEIIEELKSTKWN